MGDLRHAARMLARNPGFTLVTASLLAVGIAANAVLFSAFNSLILRPLPVRHPEALVRLVQKAAQLGTRSDFEYEVYRTLKKDSTTLEAVFGDVEWPVAMNLPAPAEQVRAQLVTPEFFDVLGVPALYGRTLTQDDARESSGAPAAVLSCGFWKRRFQGDPNAVGRPIVLHGNRFTIVGVMPREFNGLTVDTAPDLRVPLRAAPLLSESGNGFWAERRSLELAGRLKPGVTREQAHAECLALWRRATETYYKNLPNYSPTILEFELSRGMELDPLERGVSILRDRFGGALRLLGAATILLMLMVCANVSGLLLARGAGRREEIAVRLAVGASRAHLARQMLTESLLLAALGAVGGWLLAVAATPLLVRALPPIRSVAMTPLALSLNLAPDWRVALVSVAVCTLTALLCGLAPAVAASRTSLDSVLRGIRSSHGWRGRAVLVTFQVALCTLLLAGAGLLVRTFRQLQAADVGFDRDHIATFTADPGLSAYTTEQASALRLELARRVRNLPGVTSVATSTLGLMRGSGMKTTVAPAGQKTSWGDWLNTSVNIVSPDYFGTMGMRIVAGRNFREADAAAKQPGRALVNQVFARRFFPHTDPIGQRFGTAADAVAPPEWEIIGVVSDAHYRSLREAVPPTFYHLGESGYFVLAVKTHGRPESIVQPVRRTLAALDPALPFIEIHTMADEVDATAAPERLTAALASIFGGVAALLAAVGIYGLLAFAVEQRRREIGIRMALGACPADIGRMIGRQSLWMVAAGAAFGLAATRLAGPWVRSLLYLVGPSDPVSLLGAVAFLALVAALATAIPTARAIRVEPAASLREENGA